MYDYAYSWQCSTASGVSRINDTRGADPKCHRNWRDHVRLWRSLNSMVVADRAVSASAQNATCVIFTVILGLGSTMQSEFL
jgi:hypothetical protein